MRFPKINSVRFAVPVLGAALMLIVLPFLLRALFGVFPWPLCALGGAVLFVFGILRIIERRQDSDRHPHYLTRLTEDLPFDPKGQEAVLRCSVCTGEQVACFRNRADGSLTEVMLIKSESDLARFRSLYGLGEVKRIY